MTLFFLVRHAVTAHTNKRLSGWMPDVPLTELGTEQAESVARRLQDIEFDAVYSSPIQRAVETARPIARAQGLKVLIRDAIGEVDYGDWTGRSLRTLARTKLWSRVQKFPSDIAFPAGESLREVQSRAITELERFREAFPAGKVCVVSHGDVIRLAIAHYAGVHIDLFQRIHVGPASVSVIGVSDEGPSIFSVNIPVEMESEEA
jgi:probable phosphomutase (TIGR03848 family)